MVPTDPAPGHDVYWRCLKTSAGLIFTVILASCQWGYLLFYRNPEDQRKPCADNKQEEAEIKQGLVAEWPPLPTKKWKEEVLPCSHMLTLKQGVSRSCLDRSPVWSTEWKEIKQHISASLQLLGQSYWYCRSAEYRWGYWVYLVSEGNAFKPFTLWKKKNKHQRSFGHDILYYRYSGPMYSLYNFPSWGSCCQKMVIHNACILHYLSARRWGGWWLVRLKSEEGEGSNCWCRSH